MSFKLLPVSMKLALTGNFFKFQRNLVLKIKEESHKSFFLFFTKKRILYYIVQVMTVTFILKKIHICFF
jgi:hypothetical protein